MKGEPTGFWAKLTYNEQGEIREWYPLLAHSADVAATTEMLLTRTILGSRLSTLIGWEQLSDAHISRLCVLAAIHDAGKVNHGFQNRAYVGVHPRAGHVSPIIEALESEQVLQLFEPLHIDSLQEWFPSVATLKHFLLATFSHHGQPVLPKGSHTSRLWKEEEQRNPQDGLRQLGKAVRAWYPQAFTADSEPFPNAPALQHAYNGVLTLADWMGSDRQFFEFAEDMDDYIELARDRARQAVETLHLDPTSARDVLGKEPVTFGAVSPYSPYPIQQQSMELPDYEQGSLTILESDTGSGKTEAALGRFLRLYQAGLVDGMYFAVPTRSAATQLHHRVVESMKRCFPDADRRPPVIQAVSGYIKADETEATPLPSYDVWWPDDPRDIMRQRGWAAEHSKRYLAGPIVVGTIDQILLSTLEVNHAHMRAAALLRHLLVVDEVHASDAYMTGLLQNVLDHHLAGGGHAFLMSATLGTAARSQLATPDHSIPSAEEAEQAGYPLITHMDSQRDEISIYEPSSLEDHKSVEPLLEPIGSDSQAIAQRAFTMARQGARVLIIRNRVADCLTTQYAVEELTGGDENLLFNVEGYQAPHHSRFAPDDRRRLDDVIEQTFGEDTEQDSVVAVATQTVEQSLDIDADVLITDLCPIDVLLQRIGRLHRHDRPRPDGFGQARCHIITPEERDLSSAIIDDGRAINGPHGLGTVYQDLRTIEATWRIIEQTDKCWHIPVDNRHLVEQGTHPHRLHAIVDELGDRWAIHEEHIHGQRWADRQLSDLACINRSKPFADNEFADQLSKVQTRLGLNNYTLYLPDPIAGPFGLEVEQLPVSEWQLQEVPDDTTISPGDINTDSDGFSFTFEGQHFRYDRFGLSADT